MGRVEKAVNETKEWNERITGSNVSSWSDSWMHSDAQKERHQLETKRGVH